MAVVDIQAHFSAAKTAGRVGRARKIAHIDARPAVVGEVVETRLAKEGHETTSPPAEEGDMVVRSLQEETGFEEYLVRREVFVDRYEGPLGAGQTERWHRYRPKGGERLFFIVANEEQALDFMAPWGDRMTARPGDAVVQDPTSPRDTYRVAAEAFAATYEIIVRPAEHKR